MDQTGFVLMPANSRTYEKKGSKQVDTAFKDEKRASTLVVATSCAGDILPFQQVWSGATHRSTPSKDADGMEEALEIGFHFAFAGSGTKNSHFSTIKTMKEVHLVYELLNVD